MAPKRVLISGAGVSGSILAFWLAKHDFEIVVIERSRAEQRLGQGLEIEEPALSVVRAMGVLDELEARKTGEAGFHLRDEHGRSIVKASAGGFSPTGAMEIMRGEMTEVYYRAANAHPNVTYLYETTIDSIDQTPDKVTVHLTTRNAATPSRTETFDFLVGADGEKSHTRNLVLGTPDKINCYSPVGASVAYFSIPSLPSDWPDSEACHYPGRRIMWLRPISKDSDFTSVHLIHVGTDEAALSAANAAGDRRAQKAALAELFSRGNPGWQAKRVVREMIDASNFYSEDLKQVKLGKWSSGRVVLLGDAAWAPTPFTGQGNQLAIIGAFVLAQEMARDPSVRAFDAFEKRLRPYVESSQAIPLGGWMPYLLVPQTRAAIWAVQRALWFLVACLVPVMKRVGTLVGEGSGKEHPFDLELEGQAEIGKPDR
ncbi:hypothetical protein BDY17DRAFT_314055 [Neohortaea acidophila]|uniref:FAD-binding domain-containing protein n=1 Tax=Neohortaea acidophila TaxID=245834 RepID=A0A6A6PFR4_9PEZI|nr:uncharacterized protein BDY17DRAFT_314055 [Neohortaea acidophila]KAF2478802.1 hypothetical protein BDY17DRAFT_314055 [Neohortaea acidophila]